MDVIIFWMRHNAMPLMSKREADNIHFRWFRRYLLQRNNRKV